MHASEQMNSNGLSLVDRAIIKSHEDSAFGTDSQYSMETITDQEKGEDSNDDNLQEVKTEPDASDGEEGNQEGKPEAKAEELLSPR